MDDISQQLKNEILSLEGYIERTEDRILVTQWTSDLLNPLEEAGEGLSEVDLTTALTALQQAKTKFDVNGRVGSRIDEILDKYSSLLPEPLKEIEDTPEEDVVLSVDARADGDAFPEIADSLFEEEEAEEDANAATGPDPALFDLGQSNGSAGNGQEAPESGGFAFSGLVDEDEASSDAPSPLAFNTAEEETDSVAFGDFGDDGEDTSAESAAVFKGFTDEEEGATESAAEDTVIFQDVDEAETTPVGGSSDDLFADSAPNIPSAAEDDSDSTHGGLPRQGDSAADSAHLAKARSPQSPENEIDIFAHKISLEDIQAALDLSVQKDDLVQLQQRLRAKLTDKVVASLRKSKLAEKQFTLIPRVARFIHKGVSQPCTVLTLAKAFPALFGHIQELAKYRGSGFMTSETPEPGWALISLESPRESIGKNFMEQNQYLRYLATSLGIPSHMIRRRTLVEAIYDLLVCRMALNVTPQSQTLDWTSTSPSRNDYICVYYAEEGLRVRDLSRTTRHSSLGLCPNW